MAEMGIMAGIYTSSYPSPYPIEKFGDSPYPIPIPSQCGDSPSKQRRVRAIPTRTSLLVISSNRGIVVKFENFLTFLYLRTTNVQLIYKDFQF